MSTRVKLLFGEDVSQLLVSNIYTKTYMRKNELFVRYAVMELSVKIHGYGVDIISILVQKLHNKRHVIDKDLKLWSEFVLASPQHSNTTNKFKLSIRNTAKGTADILEGTTLETKFYSEAGYSIINKLCEKTEPIVLDRLHVCPFIPLNNTDLIFKEMDNNSSLQITVGFGKTIIPKWEYRIVNESVLICLSTYLKIYNSTLVMTASDAIDSNDAMKIQQFYVNTPMKYAAILMAVQMTLFS